MLNVKEGFPVGSQLGVVLLKEVGKSRDVVLVLPMRADEVIALDGLHPDGLIVFLETLLPSGRSLSSDALRLRRLSPDTADGSAPSVALHVVVAVDEELNCLFAVDAFIVRKDLEPSIRHHLQLGKKSLVGHVAGNDDAVHLQTTEVFQGVDERLGCVCTTQMYVAHNADYEVWIAQSGNRLSEGWRTQIGCSSKGGTAPQEFSSVHNLYIMRCKDTQNSSKFKVQSSKFLPVTSDLQYFCRVYG